MKWYCCYGADAEPIFCSDAGAAVRSFSYLICTAGAAMQGLCYSLQDFFHVEGSFT
jgi:hypothetical protein